MDSPALWKPTVRGFSQPVIKTAQKYSEVGNDYWILKILQILHNNDDNIKPLLRRSKKTTGNKQTAYVTQKKGTGEFRVKVFHMTIGSSLSQPVPTYPGPQGPGNAPPCSSATEQQKYWQSTDGNNMTKAGTPPTTPTISLQFLNLRVGNDNLLHKASVRIKRCNMSEFVKS